MSETIDAWGRVPTDWRQNNVRKGFRVPTLLEAPDYTIIQFGSSVHVLSKIGEEPFILPKSEAENPLYPRRNGHSKDENHPLNQKILYQAPQQLKVSSV